MFQPRKKHPGYEDTVMKLFGLVIVCSKCVHTLRNMCIQYQNSQLSHSWKTLESKSFFLLYIVSYQFLWII